MRAALALLISVFASAVWTQTSVQSPPIAATQSDDTVYFCPMDPDIRSNHEGKCSRCGMVMVSGLPEPVEYHVDLTLVPNAVKAGQRAHLRFSVHDPWMNRPVTKFQLVHERLFHMFVVSQDLQVFVHDHPMLGEDGDFHYDLEFPKGGMYRVLGDFYPEGATPQLIPKTVMVSGPPPKPAMLSRDYSTKDAENIQVSLSTIPPEPIAGFETQMYFTLNPADGFEKYLGAWGHMLAASDDLIDLIHEHPFIADGGPRVEFKLIFPRAHIYRVWVQFQRKGTINTVHFDVPVKVLG